MCDQFGFARSDNEIILKTDSENGLRKESVLKVDRIVTGKNHDVIATIGKLSEADLLRFKQKFKNLIEV